MVMGRRPLGKQVRAQGDGYVRDAEGSEGMVMGHRSFGEQVRAQGGESAAGRQMQGGIARMWVEEAV